MNRPPGGSEHRGRPASGRWSTAVLVLVVPVLAVVAVLVTFAVTDDPATGGSAGDLAIVDFAYAPETFQAKSGVAFSVVNQDGATHTVTADDDSFDTGDVKGGAKASLTIDAPGTYEYFCEIHDYMRGTIDVR